MDRYDPRLIRCPRCLAELGAWCGVLLDSFGRSTEPVVGHIHSERHQLAGRLRRAGTAPDGQRKLPGID